MHEKKISFYIYIFASCIYIYIHVYIHTHDHMDYVRSYKLHARIAKQFGQVIQFLLPAHISPLEEWKPVRKKDACSGSDLGTCDPQPNHREVVLSAATVPGFEEPILAAPAEPVQDQPQSSDPTVEELAKEMEASIGQPNMSPEDPNASANKPQLNWAVFSQEGSENSVTERQHHLTSVYMRVCLNMFKRIFGFIYSCGTRKGTFVDHFALQDLGVWEVSDDEEGDGSSNAGPGVFNLCSPEVLDALRLMQRTLISTYFKKSYTTSGV